MTLIVHEQTAPVVTVIVELPPAAGKFRFGGAIA